MATVDYSINLNKIARGSGNGNRNASLSNIIRSKNWLGGAPATPELKENSGLVFITKPDFNLTSANIAGLRELSPLMIRSSATQALGSAIRDGLDPRSAMSEDAGSGYSKLNDPSYPFFGLLDNTMTELSGWPDYVMDEYVSTPGKAGMTYLSAKGRIKKYQKFDLSATHRNLPGDTINVIYTYWQLYMDYVRRWVLSSHPQNIAKNRLDYVSRIYRFVFDSTGTKLNQFTMSGYGFPKASSQGAVMNLSTDSGVNQGYDTISASWSNVGVFHNDPIVIDEFNRTVLRFNPLMGDAYREANYIKAGTPNDNNNSNVTIPSLADISNYNYQGYPRINPLTLEFEVWIPNAIYKYLNQPPIDNQAIVEAVAKAQNTGIDELTTEEFNELFLA